MQSKSIAILAFLTCAIYEYCNTAHSNHSTLPRNPNIFQLYWTNPCSSAILVGFYKSDGYTLPSSQLVGTSSCRRSRPGRLVRRVWGPHPR